MSNLITSFGISPGIVTGSTLTVFFIITLLIALHLVLSSVFSFCSKLLSLLIKLTEYFIVPLVNYAAYCYTDMTDEI
jgi:hypothetical protein